MMLAGVPLQGDAVAELAATVRATGADDLSDRLEQAGRAWRLFSARTALIMATTMKPPNLSTASKAGRFTRTRFVWGRSRESAGVPGKPARDPARRSSDHGTYFPAF
jgi:hypothetical protein